MQATIATIQNAIANHDTCALGAALGVVEAEAVAEEFLLGPASKQWSLGLALPARLPCCTESRCRWVEACPRYIGLGQQHGTIFFGRTSGTRLAKQVAANWYQRYVEGINVRGLEVSIGAALIVVCTILVLSLVQGSKGWHQGVDLRKHTHLIPTFLCGTSNSFGVAEALADVDTVLTNARAIVHNASRVALAARNTSRSPTPVADTGTEPRIGICNTIVVASRDKSADRHHDESRARLVPFEHLQDQSADPKAKKLLFLRAWRCSYTILQRSKSAAPGEGVQPAGPTSTSNSSCGGAHGEHNARNARTLVVVNVRPTAISACLLDNIK
ncbi:hypothetical protein KCV03_g30, partial [Aureobasidium melanogenum]